MSIIYKCDICKKEITIVGKRVILQISIPETDHKKTMHMHKACYGSYVLPALDGKLFEDEMKSSATDNEDKVKTTATTSVVEEKEEPKTEEAFTSPYSNLHKFNKPQIKKRSDYFTEATCYTIHRFILLGARNSTIAKKMGIPYQTFVNYVKAFDIKCVDDYKPENPTDVLENIIRTHYKKLPMLKALITTGTWSIESAANEADIPETVAQAFWNDLPWFMSRWDSITSKAGSTSEEVSD